MQLKQSIPKQSLATVMDIMNSKSTKTKVLLAGASDSIGREILTHLIEQKNRFEIAVFDRKSSGNMTFFERNKDILEVYYGDVLDYETLQQACRRQDFVIHNMSLPKGEAMRDHRQAETVNLLGTRNLIEAVEATSPGAMILYLSTVGVYGDRLHSPMISVSDTVGPVIGDYDAITKLQAEKIVRDSKLDWIIYRPGYVLHTRQERLSPDFFRLPLASRLEFIHTKDLATAVVEAYAHRAKLWGHTFNVGGGELCRITYSKLVERFLERLHLKYEEIPDHCFAARNGSGGYFADSHVLQEIIAFQTYTVDRYFEELDKSRNLIRRVGAALWGAMRGKSFFSQSEPLKAYKSGDPIRIKYYF